MQTKHAVTSNLGGNCRNFSIEYGEDILTRIGVGRPMYIPMLPRIQGCSVSKPCCLPNELICLEHLQSSPKIDCDTPAVNYPSNHALVS